MKKPEIVKDDIIYIWHPFTQMTEYEKEEPYPVIIEEGNGEFLKDIDGNLYIDGVSSLWVNVHGHRKKEIDEAVKSQLEKIAHSTLLGISNVPAVKLAKRLAEIAPVKLNKIFYSDNGSTAVEVALKIGLQYWQLKGRKKKQKFVSFINAYHGDTVGAVSVGGIDLFHQRFAPLLFDSFKVPYPYCYRCHKGLERERCLMKCVEDLEKILEENREEIAALVIEPLIQAAGGFITAPSGYLSGVRKLCSKFDILMIADEVAAGFGRTGKMFACQHEDVSPDMMAVAKGITGGYLPLAATITTEEIYSEFLGSFAERKTFFHGHTYTGNPLACAAALANLEIFEKEKTLENLQDKIKFLKETLEDFNNLLHVGDIRQAGFMAGIELVKDRDTKEPYLYEEQIGRKVILEARRRGAIIRPLGDVIVLVPPLSIDIETLQKLLEITYQSIKVVTEK